MSQITGIGFSNFRVFKDSTYFDLAPISIFTGTNSSGKSSIFKGLLLLKNNHENHLELSFSGDEHKLGTFENSRNKSSDKGEISFNIGIDKSHAVLSSTDCLFFKKLVFSTYYKQNSLNSEGGSLTQSFVFVNDNEKQSLGSDDILLYVRQSDESIGLAFNLSYFISKIKEEIMPGAQNNVFEYYFEKDKLLKYKDYDFSLASPDQLKSIGNSDINSFSEEEFSDLINHLNESLLDRFRAFSIHPDFGIESINTPLISSYSSLLNEYKDLLALEDFLTSDIRKQSLTEFLGDTLKNEYARILGGISVEEILKKEFISICTEYIIPEINYMINAIKYGLKGLKYIGSARANSQRLYSNQSQGTSFNQLLLEVGQRWASISKNTSLKYSPYNFVKKWIKEFGIGDDISITRIKGIATEVSFIKNDKKIDLIDLGYGVTQFLPILLDIALNYEFKDEWQYRKVEKIVKNNGPLLLIEEPEANLHPKLQSLLADFFVDVVKTFEVTLLLETHSEYLIRRMQVLTAAKEVAPENTVIYYLNGDTAKEKQDFVTTININPDGSLTNDFGPGFIDEATNWKLELMRLKNAQLQNLN